MRQWRYNQYAELERATDPLGQVTQYDYDARGNLVAAAQPDGAEVSTRFNEQDLPVQGTDANGGKWQWGYDEYGRLLHGIDPTGATTHRAYDESGRLVEIKDTLGNATRMRYDEANQLSQTIAPDGSTSSQTRDLLGRVVKLTDANGHVEQRRYDRLGQLTGVASPDGHHQRYRYNASGKVVHAESGQQQAEFAYTPMGQLARRRQQGESISFSYDLEGNLTDLTNERDELFHFILDATGRVTEEVGFDGLTRRYERDAAGRIVQVRRPANHTTAYTYDAAGRVLQVTYNNVAHAAYRYRPDGVLLEATTPDTTVHFERDLLGRVMHEIQNGHEVRNTYDVNGRRSGLASSLGAAATFERDAQGKVCRMQAETWQSTVERDAAGLEINRQLSGGIWIGWYYDAVGRPTSQRITTGGGVSRQRRYTWQRIDQLVEMDDSLTGRTSLSYNLFGSLTGATYADGQQELRQPDAVGNLFRTTGRTDRAYGKGGQLREADGTRYRYDEEGNLMRKTLADGQQWHYEWDGSGQLTCVRRPDGYSVVFTYDALGRRTSKRFRGKVTRWVWDGDKPLHEWSELEVGPGAGSVTDLTTWLFEEDSLAPAAKITSTGAQSVVCDHLGTPLELYDGQGVKTWQAQLDTYGAVRQGKGKPQDCPFRYQGQYEDVETGLHYNRFRYYDPEAGNYISQDPMGLLGGGRMYGYVPNPMGWIDPFGLMPFWKPLKPTGMGHHPIPRAQANGHQLPKLGTPYDTPSWYPNEVNGSDMLHQNMHDALTAEGIPFKEPFKGTQGEMLDRVRQGYQGMDQKGFLKIPDNLPNANNALATDITISEAVEKQLEWNRLQGLNAGPCPP